MGVRLDERWLREKMTLATHSVDVSVRTRSQDELIMMLQSTETLETWGRGLARKYGRVNDWEELTQVITEHLIRYVRTMAPDRADHFDQVERVAAHLYFHSKDAVVAWLDSAAVTVASAMAGASRRHRRSHIARNEFIAKFGREPSAHELVAWMNAEAYRTRKDPQKQGMLVTPQDVEGVALNPYSVDYQADGELTDGRGIPTDDTATRARGELSVTIRQLGVLADEMYPEVTEPTVREVLSVWMDLVLDNEVPSILAVSTQLDLSRPRARERMQQVEGVLARLRTELN